MVDRDGVPLRAETDRDQVDGTPVATVVFEGDLDLPSVADFRVAVSPEVLGDVGGVIVDLSGVRFVDSSGIHALLSAWKALNTSGMTSAVVVEGGSNVERVLAMTGLLEEIQPAPDRAAAVAAIATRR